MPGSFKKNTALGATPRPIHSDLKSKRIVWETEHPVRWSFMKVLRETSSLKQFYPDINPYTEVYQVRDHVYAFYNDSFDGAGDVWMYLIDGPEKALLIDTSFGVGDLKGLIRHLIGDKEVIVCNTHAHYDHCYGNGQFERVYCHRHEVPDLMTKNNPDIWDYLFNNTDKPVQVWDELIPPGDPVYTHFDKRDIVVDREHREAYVPYEIIGIEDGHEFDLGGGVIVEAVLLPGHTPGQCGYYDRQKHLLFCGDITGIGSRPKGTPYGEFCTVEAMSEALKKLQPRFAEIDGVFPGHGAWDQSPLILQYLLDTVMRILENPENADGKRSFDRDGKTHVSLTKNIHQWTALRYSPDRVYKRQFTEEE
jgi:glyoxylase-like metal-dependent hydrolase (beta-lactamase superfamily II)